MLTLDILQMSACRLGESLKVKRPGQLFMLELEFRFAKQMRQLVFPGFAPTMRGVVRARPDLPTVPPDASNGGRRLFLPSVTG